MGVGGECVSQDAGGVDQVEGAFVDRGVEAGGG